MSLEIIIQTIKTLSSDMVMMDESSQADEWAFVIEDARGIAASLTAEKEVSLAEAASLIVTFAEQLATGSAPYPENIIKQIHALLEALQTLEHADTSSATQVKETLAHAHLFLRDIASTESLGDGENTIEPELLMEVGGRVDGLEQLLFSLTPDAQDPEDVRSVFRECHTLKGEAGILGLTTLHAFFHQVESAIEDARYAKLVFNAETIDTLLQLVQIARLLLHAKKDKTTKKAYIDEKVGQLVAAVAACLEVDPDNPTASTADSSYGADDDDDDFFSLPADSADAVADSAAAPQETADDDMFAMTTAETNEASSTKEEESKEEGAEDIEDAEEELPVAEETLQTIRLDVRRIDKLMELVEEVALAGTRFAQNEEIQKIRSTASELNDLARSCRSLHDLTADLRMTPVRPLFQRAQRAVFAAARDSHKRVAIKLEGVDTEVDRSIIDRLTAAMVHVVRNAVGHGIEPSAERRSKGKPDVGTITLRAYRTEANIVIEICDDGKGLNLEQIRSKAVELGQIKEDETLSKADLTKLIFSSGLSTARSLTGLSGRGVGMDVVSQSIVDMRGQVDVDSTTDVGTTIRFSLPLALTAIEGLLVEVGENVLIFPVSIVRESFRVTNDQVYSVEEVGRVVRIRGIVVPLLILHDHLGLAGEPCDPCDGVIVLMEDGERLGAVLVNKVLESRQVIIRQMEGGMAQNPAISGAVVLGDRRVALVIETRSLLNTCSVTARDAFTEASDRQVLSERKVSTVQIGSNQVGMIDFTITTPGTNSNGKIVPQDHNFAINAFKVREFVAVAELTPLPHAPPGFVGMLLLRGDSIPVLSLSMLLGFIKEEERRKEWEPIIVICEFSGRTVGFLANRVNRVSYVAWSDIQPPPDTNNRFPIPYVVGTILMRHLLDDADEELDCEDVPPRAVASAISTAPTDKIAFVLDYEHLVQNVISLYSDEGVNLEGVQQRKSKNRILLVEDSGLIRRQMKKALEKAGMEVMEADNGETGLNIVKDLWAQAQESNSSIFAYLDLVLSDIEMPRMDGYSLTSTIKKHPQLCVLPVILHSSITNDTMIARAREVDADGFVAKCNPEELTAQLRKYL